jgi:hypothetical protein
MTPKKGQIRLAFDRAYRQTEQNKRDQGAVLLARLYADQLDHAAELSADADLILEQFKELCAADHHKYVASLAKSLVARQTVSEIGPKYLAALTALHLTSAARAAAKTTEGGSDESADPADRAFLDLQARGRERHAASVDSPATTPDT